MPAAFNGTFSVYKIRTIFFLVVIATWIFPSASNAQLEQKVKCYKIGVWDFSEASQMAIAIIEKMYESNGLCYEFIRTSLAKARHDLLHNTLDANIWRSDLFITKNKEKIIHTTPVFSLSINLYVNTKRAGKGLKKKDLIDKNIGFFHGDLHIKRDIDTLKAKAIHGESFPHIFNAFIRERFDIIAIPPVIYASYADTIPTDFEIETIPISTQEYHHVLHKNNSDILPKLNASLNELLMDGKFHKQIKKLESKFH
ncbi:substrate-binding periplasmic protein [Curvivirga aplysinae]|uniref:substrate-binding periplasmic protein n=1 Tax=Curvivirga aplysinae TaxID=2529852 RepID=UPI001C3F82B8|nr:transporter substrate-binding domain-containing protein [Curvivirga aplysinae]